MCSTDENMHIPAYVDDMALFCEDMNINVEVVAHSQTNTSRTTLKLGEGIILKSHPFCSRIYSLMFLPNYFVQHCCHL